LNLPALLFSHGTQQISSSSSQKSASRTGMLLTHPGITSLVKGQETLKQQQKDSLKHGVKL
jgi:hypothetical protein